MEVEVWSDVVCPWCYIGKRHLEAALADFAHRDDVKVTWRSYQLDPSSPSIAEGDPIERLSAKYGMSRQQAEAAQARVTAVAAAAGLEYHLDRARSGNTFNAHRLLHLAAERGLQDALKERLMKAYFTEGAVIGDPTVLIRLAAEAGLDEAEASAVLSGDDYADAVRDDIRVAREIGISGVPFFVIDRAYGVSGAQPAEVILGAITTAWQGAHPLQMVPGTTRDACDGDDCPV